MGQAQTGRTAVCEMAEGAIITMNHGNDKRIMTHFIDTALSKVFNDA